MLKKTNKKVKYNGYIHLQSYDPNSVLALVGPDNKYIEVDIRGTQHRINVKSLRLQCFKRSRVCVECGLVGTIMSVDTFTIKSDRTGVHFNLYGEKDGKSRLMTKDHIIPKPKGGPDHLDNLQTMCDHCNNAKGDISPDEKKYIVVPEEVALYGDKLNITIGASK